MNTDNGNNMTRRATCKELGWKVGDKFKVLSNASPMPYGTIVILHTDDGTSAPFYTVEGETSGRRVCFYSDFLEPYVEAKELTGDSSAYYSVVVSKPTDPNKEKYSAECNDIIEALNMTFAEGNAFKAIWRTAAARQGNGKPGHTAKYDAEKVVFFGQRMLAQAKWRMNETYG